MSEATATQNDILERVESRYSFVPNLYRELAKSPTVAEFYFEGSDILSNVSLTEKEQQAAILAVSDVNGCDYCKAAHGAIGKMAGLTEEEIEAITSGEDPQDTRLATLVSAVRKVMEKRGWLDDTEVQALAADGVDRAQLYEIVALIALKTLSNYVNHIAHTEIDPQFGG